ncbi:MAG: hypothetical protein K2W81_09955 [Sphingomonas sp.]|uniref:DUF6118 family protein n=1 Tax=Sphingomonas sp. TaxID=28214 RepID=UPI0025ECABF2|nr:DUF6118 family protein [Sphingomonas sp.]MBY0284273.1 hypothetical protein [Sphingomonas sp.]
MTDNLSATAPVDDIDQAFEALRGEVSLTRRAVEGLTAARERVPDYSATLGQMAEVLKRTAEGIDRVEQSPAVRLSPAALTDEIVKASAEARAEDRALLRETRDALMRSIGRIDGIVERGQAADVQVRWLIWTCAGGTLAGMMLMAILPGAVARSLPASWHVPEWMAARTIGLDQRAAGERMIATSAPNPPSDAE